uniref:Uncharacterized protein n=2 Tax=Oryza TaxID=4527 RepID=A0A0E0QNR4_ORYRU
MELVKDLAGIWGPGDGLNLSTALLLSALRAELDLARAHARQLTKEDRNTWACRGVHGRFGRARSGRLPVLPLPYECFWSMPPPPPPYQQLVIPVECSQAMLASLLRARPLCGERLREARATAEHALADAKAEGDDLAAVDVNLVLTFLAARDGDLDDALRRYKAAVQKDPSDSRPYELVVAAALGSGTLTTLGLERGGRGRLVLVAPWREVDARLTAAVLDDDLDLTLPERVQLRLLHHRRPDGLWRSSTGVG